jgi:hypothetical protein
LKIKSLFLATLFVSFNSSSQNLFGNPVCLDWQTLTSNEKLTWLNAYLVQLNLTHVARRKPKVDKFSQLTSLDSAVVFVDTFCSKNRDDFASVGAIRFLEELTLESKLN